VATLLWKMASNRELRRYVLVGGLCALISNLILIVGDAAGLHYTVSIILLFIVVLPISYLAHACWTFDVELSWVAFGRFVLGSLSSFLVGSIVVAGLRGGLMLPMIVAAPLCTVAMTVYNFAMTKWAVTRERLASKLASS